MSDKQKFTLVTKSLLDFELIDTNQHNELLYIWDDETNHLSMDFHEMIEEGEVNYHLILKMLRGVELTYHIDAETGQVPPPYQDCLKSLMTFIGLDPNNLNATINDFNRENRREDYVVKVNYSDLSYTMAINGGFTDYYDHPAIRKLLYKILKDQKSEVKLYELGTEDTSFCFFIGNMDNLKKVLSHYDLEHHSETIDRLN